MPTKPSQVRRFPAALGAVVLLALAAGWWAWPHAAAVEAPTPTQPTVPQFESVSVQAADPQGGLTLTGAVRDPTGAPIAGAEVFLAASSQQSLSTVRCGVCGELLLSCKAASSVALVAEALEHHHGELVAALSTHSDAQGTFRFEHLTGTSFMVWGRAQGFGDGMKERAAPGDPVALFLPALRELHGTVRDEQGRPAVATVRVLSRRLAATHEARADAEGHFELRGLGEGPFYVQATAPGLLPAALPQVDANGAAVALTLRSPRRLEVALTSAGKPIEGTVTLSGDHLGGSAAAPQGLAIFEGLAPGAVLVSAAAGELSAVPREVTLDALTTRVSLELSRGGRLSVSVIDEAGQPVADATVELLSSSNEVVSHRKVKQGALALFGPVGVGAYSLRVSADGFQPTILPVQVTASDTPVEVSMTRGVVIAGRVVDEYGRPAAGVSVLVTPTGDSIVVDGEGRFHTVVPSPGLYSLHAHHSDWGGGEVKVTAPKSDVELQLEPRAGVEVTVTANGQRVEGAHVMLFQPEGNFRSDRPSGADGVVLMRGMPPDGYTLIATHPDYLPSERQQLTLVDGVLLKASVELKEGAAVTGQVVDTLGAPVPNVQVGVAPRGADGVVTDANGNFSVKPLRPKGSYLVRVIQRGFDQPERVTAVAGGEPVRLTVKRQPLFHGRVLGEGQPLTQFRVDEHEVNSPDGRFELPLPNTEERVIVSIEAPGYESLVADRPNTLELGDFDLKRAPLITGVVHDEGGAPVPDAVVSCDSCEQSVLSGADGKFSLGRPSLQHEFLITAKKARRTATRTVDVEASTGVELVLRPGVKLVGTAYLPDGQPAAGVELSGVNVDRSEIVSGVTNADGTYSLDVAPGAYRLMLLAAEYARQSMDPPAIITQVEGPSTRVDFGPVPGLATLSVRISPLPGYALWLVRGEVPAIGNPPTELLRSAWAELVYQPHSERVVFGGLQPGHYTLVWASFHAEMPTPPVVVPVEVPSGAEVTLVR
jgi:protocatechuate 3,4-dioxygenase beta subunit